VAAADGALDDAVSALDDALREHDRAPIPFERAWTMLVRGRVLRRRRERAAARTSLVEARDVFAGLGAARFLEIARDELTRTGIRVASGDLTATERRVAELAAAGMTNREVAAALFISPKTVDANLARAYRKLGVESRAELGARMQQLQT
jgi:DNA-binding CsgD family transcriptional regulator